LSVWARPIQQEEPATHTVKGGETLSEIAAAYGVATAELMAANGISNADQIRIGQELILPDNAVRIGAPDLAIPTHTVEAGETLSQIAEAYGVTLTRLMYLNGIRDPNAVYIGQELRLPAAIESPEETTATPDQTATADTEPADGEPLVEGEVDEVTSTPMPEPEATTTPEASATPTPSPERPATHTVRRGETLSQIAEEYGLAMDELMQLNSIWNPDAIYIGQELALIAPEPTATPTPEPTAPPANNDATADTLDAASVVISAITSAVESVVRSGNPIASLNQTYTVAPGDSVRQIARRLGIDQSSLRRINRLTDGGEPEVGSVLIVPATAGELRVIEPEEEYIVRPGDSLGLIAQEFGLSLGALMAANYIGNPNSIKVGQRLVIPEPELTQEGAAPAVPTPVEQIGPARSGYYYYTVQPGDTVAAVAEQFNSTRLAILDYNAVGSQLYHGLEIRIPFGPPPLPVDLPPVATSGSSFLVSLSRQQCWLFWGKEVRYAWTCSTGYGEYSTRTGNFAVKTKIENAKSRAYALDMPYWLGIYNVGHYENGIHGLPVSWRTNEKIWEGLIGQPTTYGCAMLADEDAAVLYDIAYIGMPVYIVN
jgi:LysM repeat protein